jgi:stress response protein YsnF
VVSPLPDVANDGVVCCVSIEYSGRDARLEGAMVRRTLAPDGMINTMRGGAGVKANNPDPSVSSDPQPRRSAGEVVEVTKVPLTEEVMRVSKQEVVTGRIRIRTLAEATDKLVQQELNTAHVSVTRIPINRIVDEAPVPRTEGDLTIVPVLEEVLVVETKLLLREEVHIRRTLTKEIVGQSVTLRKQRAVIEKLSEEAKIVDE